MMLSGTDIEHGGGTGGGEGKNRWPALVKQDPSYPQCCFLQQRLRIAAVWHDEIFSEIFVKEWAYAD